MDLSAKALPLQKLILRVQQSTKLAQICASYNGVCTHCNGSLQHRIRSSRALRVTPHCFKKRC